jgi:hypothetical protein
MRSHVHTHDTHPALRRLENGGYQCRQKAVKKKHLVADINDTARMRRSSRHNFLHLCTTKDVPRHEEAQHHASSHRNARMHHHKTHLLDTPTHTSKQRARSRRHARRKKARALANARHTYNQCMIEPKTYSHIVAICGRRHVPSLHFAPHHALQAHAAEAGPDTVFLDAKIRGSVQIPRDPQLSSHIIPRRSEIQTLVSYQCSSPSR